MITNRSDYSEISDTIRLPNYVMSIFFLLAGDYLSGALLTSLITLALLTRVVAEQGAEDKVFLRREHRQGSPFHHLRDNGDT